MSCKCKTLHSGPFLTKLKKRRTSESKNSLRRRKHFLLCKKRERFYVFTPKSRPHPGWARARLRDAEVIEFDRYNFLRVSYHLYLFFQFYLWILLYNRLNFFGKIDINFVLFSQIEVEKSRENTLINFIFNH